MIAVLFIAIWEWLNKMIEEKEDNVPHTANAPRTLTLISPRPPQESTVVSNLKVVLKLSQSRKLALLRHPWGTLSLQLFKMPTLFLKLERKMDIFPLSADYKIMYLLILKIPIISYFIFKCHNDMNWGEGGRHSRAFQKCFPIILQEALCNSNTLTFTHHYSFLEFPNLVL